MSHPAMVVRRAAQSLMLSEAEPGDIRFVPDLVEVTPDRLCAHCGQSMADGGAPLPGEGRDLPKPRACASCWRILLDLATADGPVLATARLLQDFEEEDDGLNDVCHHGVAFSDPCDGCDREIEAGAEIID